MIYSKIYDYFDADEIIPGTVGIFSNDKNHLMENINNPNNLQSIKTIHGFDKLERFETHSGWKTKYFYPICSENTWELYKDLIMNCPMSLDGFEFPKCHTGLSALDRYKEHEKRIVAIKRYYLRKEKEINRKYWEDFLKKYF